MLIQVLDFLVIYRVYFLIFSIFGIQKFIVMKIISYNVNGIRSAISKGFIEWLQQANPDVICLTGN